MFERLTERIQDAVKSLKGQGKITEENIQESLRAVRMALLEADVHVSVVKDFLEGVKAKALGQEVLRSLSPDQHFVKILNDEMVRVLGEGDPRMRFPPFGPGIILLAGLQGSGKTTTAGKLAKYFAKDGHPVMLVPADVYRPAARQQLETVGKAVGVSVFQPDPGDQPVAICQKAVDEARKKGIHRVILDTAGRLTIDEKLMEELELIVRAVRPSESLYVADAMTGQTAMATVKAFHEKVTLTGVILSKADGDARGGAILSVKAVTGLPVKFVGVGEKYDALEPFLPDRMASRILGMGDMLGLIEKAQSAVDEREAADMAERLRKSDFTLDDFRNQLKAMRKMGPLQQIVGMLPGMGAMKGVEVTPQDEKRLGRTEAILNSMTPREREHYNVIDGSRRKRIARGAGVSVSEVNQLLKQYLTMRKMMQQLKKGGLKGMMRNMGAMGKR
jgi:signal recognition particle subunit SRP54